ncbi:DUF6303 family protein [Streptomyces prunicolor]|uniref:DUF6303 family protein n=1 Tax=Streptomyces prunicolor TaxID=67348 RepID=UPI0033FA7E28
MNKIGQPVAVRAGLRRVCCDTSSDKLRGAVTGAHWELYLVVYNTTDQWPAHKWPSSRRHMIPTVTDRAKVLANFGYAPVPGAEWRWQEDECPNYHGHAVHAYVYAGIDIVPLNQATGTESGER